MSRKDAGVESGKIVLFKGSPVIAEHWSPGRHVGSPHSVEAEQACEGLTVPSERGASLCPSPDLGVACGVGHGTHRQLMRNVDLTALFAEVCTSQELWEPQEGARRPLQCPSVRLP